MTRASLAAYLKLAAAGTAVTLIAAGCGLLPANGPAALRTLTPGPGRPAILVIITNPESPAAQQTARSLIMASAQAGERIVLLSDRDGGVLASSVAPPPPTSRVPGPPAPLPADPTSFQRARYSQALHDYREVVRRAQDALRELRQQRLASWARSLADAMSRQAHRQSAGGENPGLSLGVAAAQFASLRQAGLSSGAGKVIAIIGTDNAAAQSAPVPPAGLQGSTVVVDNFPGSGDEESAWQASLVQGGAARAVLLTPVTADQFTTVVRQGLDGAVTDTLTSVLFGLGQYRLAPSARPQLRVLLRLLTVAYPRAAATIDGYTDDLPTPGGNLLLSQRRAQHVEDWLIAHNVAASRLQAVGYGDTDPVAPNTATGQSLNRRVVVIIDPVTAS
jgi:outer membrane protein OmpA-like peptidoglycan-associated protein